MAFEHQCLQGIFHPTDVVELRQHCFTPAGVFEPGVYYAGHLPSIAFEMGLVDKLPPVRGKNAEICPKQPPQDTESPET